MCAGVPPASAKSQMFEAVPGFLPDRVRITVLALIVPAVVASRVVKAKRGIARRRARRTAQTLPGPVPYGQGTGADHLGPCAPPARGERGADFLGPCAPAPRQKSGADFLGSWLPRPSGATLPPDARRSPPVRPGRWTGDRVLRPDVGGSEAADRGRAPGRTVAYAEQTCTRGIPGREH
ncbi:hypothetical protein OEB94_09980 [Streptomyces sp. ICN988]|uniref:hypothetical protein n=1 Tax=Streptomyces sp. ICN988 TaxID=2983765 RepID=UPI0021E38E16|nr:hypothetical protein [Streptomyces sp. ICN988]MCV2459592.1 hypothetical protein [Streptomyces sp. ICN988]